jgi:hypothetical protein
LPRPANRLWWRRLVFYRRSGDVLGQLLDQVLTAENGIVDY